MAVKTIGEEVDDLILTVSRVMNASTEEAVDFIIYRARKFDHAGHVGSEAYSQTVAAPLNTTDITKGA